MAKPLDIIHAQAVVELSERRLTPCGDVIEILRETLAKAEAGEIRAVAIACEQPAAVTMTVFAYGDGDRAHLVYSLTKLINRLITED